MHALLGQSEDASGFSGGPHEVQKLHVVSKPGPKAKKATEKKEKRVSKKPAAVKKKPTAVAAEEMKTKRTRQRKMNMKRQG